MSTRKELKDFGEVNGYYLEAIDFDPGTFDINRGDTEANGKVFVGIALPGDQSKKFISAGFSYEGGVDLDFNSVDVEWDEGGEPTYVPYGEGNALYDDGKPFPISGISKNADVESEPDFLALDVKQPKQIYTREEMKELLHADDATLDTLIAAGRNFAIAYLIKWSKNELEDNIDDWYNLNWD